MTIETDFVPLGIVGYNGVSFGPSLDSKVTADPVYDSAGRTIIYYVAHFHFDWIVDLANQTEPDPTNRATTTDTQLETIRQQLMHNGADFQYAANGFGYLSVNPGPASPAVTFAVPGTVDPVWGPKPRKVTFYGMNGKAAKCSFDIDVALLNCPNILAKGKIMEFCFKIGWDGEDGLTRRTYTAHLCIPATRGPGGARTLPDNADNYFPGKAVPDVPLGFRRLPVRRILSEDKCRLDITVVDEEHPSRNYPPPQSVRVEMSHNVETDGPVFVKWRGTLKGTYEYPKGVNPAKGFYEFMVVLFDRLDNITKQGGGAIIPTKLTLSEPDLYGRAKGEFSLSYRYLLTLENVKEKIKDTVQNGLAASGLWRPVPNNSYTLWAALCANTLLNNP